MRIVFTGSTNDENIWVSKIIFQMNDGRMVEVNRNITEYVVDKGKYEMVWKGCYICNGRKHDYGLSSKMFEGAKILHIEISSNAPSNYGFDISFWKVFDS